MITKEMIEKGYEMGIVRLVESPNGNGPVCAIGDDWFYFPGVPVEAADGEMTVAEFQSMVSKEELVQNIFDVLDSDMRPVGSEFEDMYQYFEEFLREHLKETLKGKPMGSLREQAERFVRENPSLAEEIFRVKDRMYYREDIEGKLPDLIDEKGWGFEVEDVPDEVIGRMAERFERGLDKNDGYWDYYWAAAEAAIEEVVVEMGLDGKSVTSPELGKRNSELGNVLSNSNEFDNDFVEGDVIDEIVEAMFGYLSGVGVDNGSGYFTLREFEVDGEVYSVVAELCRIDDGEDPYGVHHGIFHDDGGDGVALENSFDWEYAINEDELKAKVHEIANRDYSNDVRAYVYKETVSHLLDNANERCGKQEVAAPNEREMEV